MTRMRLVAKVISSLLITLLIPIGACATWGMPCDQTCHFTFGCTLMDSGFSTMNYYHRCDVDNMDCGSYDPTYPDCQKWCQWDWYSCGPDPDDECRDITAYQEACFTQ